MIDLDVGGYIEIVIDWLTENLSALFDAISLIVTTVIGGFEAALMWVPYLIIIVLLTALAWWLVGRGIAAFTLIGLFLIESMGFWGDTMVTLALVLTSALIALFFGIPTGILAARNKVLEGIVRPVLDTMQTMPAFVYLIPAVLFFGLGTVPGVVATVVFAMPPVVRLTNLGIRQVQPDVVEAAQAFGATPRQVLVKVQLPLALPTILAGINQTIMLALSMVVIAAMIGAGGLGGQVLRGITQLNVGLGFEAGFAIVILAIILDRITQALGAGRQGSKQ
mgnify:CR=1 FL=1